MFTDDNCGGADKEEFCPQITQMESRISKTIRKY